MSTDIGDGAFDVIFGPPGRYHWSPRGRYHGVAMVVVTVIMVVVITVIMVVIMGRHGRHHGCYGG